MDQNTVNQTLITIKHDDIKSLLDEKHSADPVAGIAIVNLPNIEVKNSAGLIYHFHAGRVFTSSPTSPNFVNPHYHLIGTEPYYILTGDGCEMNLGRVVDGKVNWNPPRIVESGDLVEVQEGEVHSLRNTGKDPLDFTFACPDEHLVDHTPEHPEGDRYVVKDLPNGLPAHYPKS